MELLRSVLLRRPPCLGLAQTTHARVFSTDSFFISRNSKSQPVRVSRSSLYQSRERVLSGIQPTGVPHIGDLPHPAAHRPPRSVVIVALHFYCEAVSRIFAGNYFGALKQWTSLQCDSQVCERKQSRCCRAVDPSPAERRRPVPLVLHSRPPRHHRQEQQHAAASRAALAQMRRISHRLRAAPEQVHTICAKSRAAARVPVLAAAVLHAAVLAPPHDAVQVQKRIHFAGKPRQQHRFAYLPCPASCRYSAVRLRAKRKPCTRVPVLMRRPAGTTRHWSPLETISYSTLSYAGTLHVRSIPASYRRMRVQSI